VIIKPATSRSSTPRYETEQIVAKVTIKERIDDRIGGVVGKVQIKYPHPVRDERHGHEERRQERHDEHDGDDE